MLPKWGTLWRMYRPRTHLARLSRKWRMPNFTRLQSGYYRSEPSMYWCVGTDWTTMNLLRSQSSVKSWIFLGSGSGRSSSKQSSYSKLLRIKRTTRFCKEGPRWQDLRCRITPLRGTKGIKGRAGSQAQTIKGYLGGYWWSKG